MTAVGLLSYFSQSLTALIRSSFEYTDNLPTMNYVQDFVRTPVYGRAEILDACAGTTFEGYERTIDAHIKNIRKALGDDSDRPRFIATVRGVGYKLLETQDEA